MALAFVPFAVLVDGKWRRVEPTHRPYRPGCGFRNRKADRREARSLRLARELKGGLA